MKNYILFSLVFFTFISFSQTDKTSSQDSLTWYVYVGGKTDHQWLTANLNVAKNMGIKTEYFFGDCVGTYNFKQVEFEEKNQCVFSYLIENFGKDWKIEYDKQVQLELKKLSSL